MAGIRKGDFLTSIDLTEAYLHIPIFPPHRRFLRFYYEGVHYQYRALPFGLSSAPCTFTKVLAALAAHLRAVPVRVQCYLDDTLIQSSLELLALKDFQVTVTYLTKHGLSINMEKKPVHSLYPFSPPWGCHRFGRG